MTRPARLDAFLSYARGDLETARWLSKALAERGLTVWFDEESIRPGQRWPPEIGRALDTAPAFIVLFGREVGSFQQLEIDGALEAARLRQARFLPILLPGGPNPSSLPPFARHYQCVDLRQGSSQLALDQIVDGLGEGGGTGRRRISTPESALFLAARGDDSTRQDLEAILHARGGNPTAPQADPKSDWVTRVEEALENRLPAIVLVSKELVASEALWKDLVGLASHAAAGRLNLYRLILDNVTDAPPIVVPQGSDLFIRYYLGEFPALNDEGQTIHRDGSRRPNEEELDRAVRRLAVLYAQPPPMPESPRPVETLATDPPGEGWAVEHRGPWRLFPNGLRYRVCRLRQRLGRKGLDRGKQYDLSQVRDSDREVLLRSIERHSEICDRLSAVPSFPQHRCTLVQGTNAWVIDHWIDGETLHERLQRGPLASKQRGPVITQILAALRTLHRAGIIRRQLSPHHILFDPEESRIYLTDFELAKLIDGSPTVGRGTWGGDDPYLAPEAAGHARALSEQSDLYSWAMIAVHIVSGRIPPSVEGAGKLIREANLPRRVSILLARCLAADRSRRPDSIDQVANGLSGPKALRWFRPDDGWRVPS